MTAGDASTSEKTHMLGRAEVQCGACGGPIPPLPVACPADPQSYCAVSSVSACTYYAGCRSPATTCGYCTDHCLCDVGVSSPPASDGGA